MYYNYVIKGMLHGGENMNFMFLPQEHKIRIIELYGVMYLLIVWTVNPFPPRSSLLTVDRLQMDWFWPVLEGRIKLHVVY